jgi:hypothetical protein
MKTPKRKPEDNPDMKVLKTSTCKTLSGKSTLTYQIGVAPDSVVHLRITKNTGAGFFSDEWISVDDIHRTLEKRPDGSPVLSHFITPLLKGKSSNTSGFILAALSHLRLVTPVKGKKRHHELPGPEDFTASVRKLSSSSAPTKTGGKTVRRPTKKTATRKAAVKKASVKKRAAVKRKKATSRSVSIKKASSAS